jgi:hypothetical protein
MDRARHVGWMDANPKCNLATGTQTIYKGSDHDTCSILCVGMRTHTLNRVGSSINRVSNWARPITLGV